MYFFFLSFFFLRCCSYGLLTCCWTSQHEGGKCTYRESRLQAYAISLINNVGRVIHKSPRGVLHNVTMGETRAFLRKSWARSSSFFVFCSRDNEETTWSSWSLIPLKKKSRFPTWFCSALFLLFFPLFSCRNCSFFVKKKNQIYFWVESLSCLWLDLSSSRLFAHHPRCSSKDASNLDSLRDPSVKSISSSCYKTASPKITSANKEEETFLFSFPFLFVGKYQISRPLNFTSIEWSTHTHTKWQKREKEWRNLFERGSSNKSQLCNWRNPFKESVAAAVLLASSMMRSSVWLD